MPLLDRQQRGHQIGEIRLGTTIVNNNGKRIPTKLEAFRFTTPSRLVAEAIAALFGGETVETTLLNHKQTFEVVTDRTELPVMVPPGDAVINQWYEQWTGAGLARRCDGITEQLKDSPCKCPSDLDRRKDMAKSGGACKPITRLNVMIPDLPDLGVWLVQSTGDNAADELGQTAQVLADARNAGVIIPATLRMEQREQRRDGEKPKKFAVPVLQIDYSLRDMVAIGQGSIADALPPAPPTPVPAITSGQPGRSTEEVEYADVIDDDPSLWAVDLSARVKPLGQSARTKLFAWLNAKHPGVSVSAVPGDLVDEVEAQIEDVSKVAS